jgi:multicomponent Na+:H+ antiporter subunit G
MTSDLPLLASVLVLVGAGLVALAGLGLLRLPDPLTRASAVSKAAALGVAVVLIAALVDSGSPRVLVVLLVVLTAHVVTVPLSGLVLGRAAYRSGTARPPVTRVDEPAEREASEPDGPGAPRRG